MRWEDERYVRLFTRDTAEWLAFGWEAQALLALLIRKCDRTGFLPTKRLGVRGLAALVAMPLDVAARAAEVLLEDGCLREVDGGYIFPNFLDAQETRSNDRQRKADQRERDRARILAQGVKASPSALDSLADLQRNPPLPPSPDVTSVVTTASGLVTDWSPSVTSTTDLVTDGVTDVTAGHSVPCRAVPCRAVPEDISSVPDDDASLEPLLEASVERESPRRLGLFADEPKPDPLAAVRDVFDHYVVGWKRVVGGSKPPMLDDKRRGKIKARLASGYAVADLKRAVDGLWGSSWHIEKKQYDIELVCRDATHVDAFIRRADEAEPDEDFADPNVDAARAEYVAAGAR